MLPFLRGGSGDPGRIHQEGNFARVAIENARDQVATLFGSLPSEVVFTATGTEAINTAIWGALERNRIQSNSAEQHIVTSQVEHSAVLDACTRSEEKYSAVGVDQQGRFSAETVIAAFQSNTTLLSLQLANHEVGTIQSELPKIIAAAQAREILVHIDARSASGYLPVKFSDLGVDLCSVTAHTWGGPPGAAALIIKRGLRIAPFIVGGMQERARRGGTENVPAIVGFGAAAEELATNDRLNIEATRARTQTTQLTNEATALSGVEQLGDPDNRLPHLVCISVNDIEAEPILLGLDQRGVAVHSGSSCSSEALEPSPVLTAMGVEADKSLRVSVGWNTTDREIEAFTIAFPQVLDAMRALRNC